MYFDRLSLLSVISAAVPLCKGNKALPILCAVHLTLIEGGLRVCATNLDMSLRMVMPMEPEAMDGRKLDVAVDAVRLKNVLSEIDDEKVEMSYGDGSASGPLLIIKGGGIEARLITMDAEEFPPLCIGCTAEGGVTVPQKELQRLLAGALDFVSTDETRYVLNGVHLSFEHGRVELRATATDGRRLGRLTEVVAEEDFLELKAARGAQLGETGILPRGAVATLSRLLRGDGPCTVSFRHGQGFTVLGGQWRLTGKLIEGNWPNVDGVIPKTAHVLPGLDGTRLREMIEHVLPLLGSGSSVRLLLDGDGMATVQVSTADVGEMTETARVVASMGKCPPLTIALNADYILSGLPQGLCEFGYTDPASPLLIEAEEWPRMAVVMPMRVND